MVDNVEGRAKGFRLGRLLLVVKLGCFGGMVWRGLWSSGWVELVD